MANLSDFDFDELDKAVAGALSDTAETSNDVPEPFLDEVPKTKVESAPEATATPVGPRIAPAARRTSGRFMDVVHPSSDMRTKTPGFTPPAPVAPSPKPEAAPQEEGGKEDWAKPLESPFLPDAKVEKRPLGTMPATGDASQEDELLLEAPDELMIEAHTMPDPIDFAAHANALPSETEDTGASQESVEESAPEVSAEEVAIKEVVEARVDESPQPEVTSEVHESHDEVTPEVVEPVGPASISQQYTEQPSTSPESGAIYDTESYHQPLAPAPKKKSGALVFVWIFLLVIVGAAAGVGFYLFILPSL